MRHVTAAEIDGALNFPVLIEALRAGFASEIAAPLRQHHAVARAGAADATLLVMPAWTGPHADAARIGIKTVTVFPDNRARALPTIMGLYTLLSGETGAPLAVMDAPALTLWRTAAASALAASYLARIDARRLVMIGAGALAPYLARAHASMRPIEDILVWNRDGAKARALAGMLAAEGLAARAGESLEEAVREADIVSCATLSPEPLVRGEWLAPGCHLDLVGAFRPDMRESDDEAVRRASLFVDTRAGALAEAGDLAMPIAAGIVSAQDVRADLAELARGRHRGRESDTEITLFKSVGTAVEDLAAADLVHRILAEGDGAVCAEGSGHG